MLMVRVLDKFKNIIDARIEKILLFSYFLHQFSFVISASALARNIPFTYKIISSIMILTFLFIVLGCFYYFLIGEYSITEIIIYSSIGVLIVISLYFYRSVMVIANLFAIATFKNIDWKKTLRCYIYATAIGMTINVILGLITPYTGNVIQTRMGVERIRYGLGFFYTSMLPFYFTSLVLTILLVVDKIKTVHYIVIIAINIILFILTDTKAPFIYIFMILVMYIVFKNSKSKWLYNFFGIATTLSYPFFFIVSYVLSANFSSENKFEIICNRVLTGRLRLTKVALDEFGFRFFGQTVPIISDETFHVDSSMISMLMLNGLIVLIISIAFMTFFSYIAYKTDNALLLIALFFIAFRSSFDLGFMAMQFSPVIFLFIPTYKKFINKYKTRR